MNTKQEFIRLMNTQTELALATCVDNQPHVRIVNFCFDKDAKVVLFTTFGDNDKVKEFEANSRVAFSTIPKEDVEHIKATGVVKKSPRTLDDVAELFIQKIPGYDETLAQAGEFLVLLEIAFTSATVTLNFEEIETYTLI